LLGPFNLGVESAAVTLRNYKNEPIMRHLHNSLSVLFVGALFLAGCAGAPETPSAPPGATSPPQPTRPPPAPAAQPRTQPDPAASVEGMTVFEMQERLNELGYKLGTVDGVAGPRTVEALKKFQSDNKLSPTGTIDADTIKKLRAAK
jgi:peptidoglycan hydrolase-like protein with peptidoglycan-binding domain